jgi:hypothetical protein
MSFRLNPSSVNRDDLVAEAPALDREPRVNVVPRPKKLILEAAAVVVCRCLWTTKAVGHGRPIEGGFEFEKLRLACCGGEVAPSSRGRKVVGEPG